MKCEEWFIYANNKARVDRKPTLDLKISRFWLVYSAYASHESIQKSISRQSDFDNDYENCKFFSKTLALGQIETDFTVFLWNCKPTTTYQSSEYCEKWRIWESSYKFFTFKKWNETFIQTDGLQL